MILLCANSQFSSGIHKKSADQASVCKSSKRGDGLHNTGGKPNSDQQHCGCHHDLHGAQRDLLQHALAYERPYECADRTNHDWSEQLL